MTVGVNDVKVERPFVQLVRKFREQVQKLTELVKAKRLRECEEVTLDLADEFMTLQGHLRTLRRRMENSWTRTMPAYRETNLSCAAAADPLQADLANLTDALSGAPQDVVEIIAEQIKIISDGLLEELEPLYDETRAVEVAFGVITHNTAPTPVS